jgi:hypothetical protein
VSPAIEAIAGQLDSSCSSLLELREACLDDLQVQMGCCSDKCTAAIQKVSAAELLALLAPDGQQAGCAAAPDLHAVACSVGSRSRYRAIGC